MKYVCLGYHEESAWEALPQADREAFVGRCLEYDDGLRRAGALLQGHALQPTDSAATLRSRGGRVVITDGPFAETKEQLGGLMLLEAKDLNHAIHLLENHPCMGLGGCFEIRPINEILTEEIDRRARNISGQTIDNGESIVHPRIDRSTIDHIEERERA